MPPHTSYRPRPIWHILLIAAVLTLATLPIYWTDADGLIGTVLILAMLLTLVAGYDCCTHFMWRLEQEVLDDDDEADEDEGGLTDDPVDDDYGHTPDTI